MRTAIYARVSTTDQNNELQISELTAYTKARGWTLSEVHQDTMSGAKVTRPGLSAILEAARSRRIDVVLVWKLDRFGRSVRDLLTNIQILESSGVRFISTTQGIDTDQFNPVARFTLTILGAAAELEREMIVERCRTGIAQAKKKGVKFGRHKRVFNRKRAFDMRAAGASIRTIADELEVGVGTIHRLFSPVPQVPRRNGLKNAGNIGQDQVV